MDMLFILNEIAALRALVEQQQTKIATLELLVLTNIQEENKEA